MRIAFVGKGGSGKTTLASLFCLHLAQSGLPVLAIDADINQHLATAIGMSPAEASAMPGLGGDLPLIKEWLRGANPRIGSVSDMVKTTPPGSGSRLLRFGSRNPVFGTFGRRVNGITLLATGGFDEDDIGVKCFHAKTGAVELLLNHLIDGAGEYVVVDMTAGADSFASGLFTKFDLTVLVVEPTARSLSVHDQYLAYAREYDVPLVVVANKVESAAEVAYVRGKVGDRLIASVYRSEYVRSTERDDLGGRTLERENAAALSAVLDRLDSRKKDWPKLQRQANHFHVLNARAWANVSVGRDLASQVDPTFSLEERAAQFGLS